MATTDDNSPIVLSDDGVRICITTKRLLKFISNERPLYIDTSFQIIRHKAISVFGICDYFDESFKPVGLAITTNESIDDYEFIFMSIKEWFDYDYKPSALISIATPAIRKAAENLFGNETIIFMSSLYAQNCIHDLLIKDSSINKKDRMEIMKDFRAMMLIGSRQSFNEHFHQFLLKWDKYGTFVTNFKENWIIENPNWSNDVGINALQYLLNSMKGMDSLDSINNLKQVVTHWSNKY